MNIFDRVTNYLKLSYIELKKVVWPSQKEVTQHTLLVIGISIGVAIFLGIVDYILQIALGVIIIK
ncbi:MAG: preprotein translocase subunit SecE [Candidatus Buchananbacteria bacterium RIFCSPLOWO2_02_FULL_46_11b]|uniref:Protein translocase subunit SecE n=1 Tax=Candidatus Buchananbacteria bacterium RIFCSPLOWO2_02_FULL_46_11b TaxID=1797548 RepID=A0A1G1YTY6_9BACT|nr:MAG: preprotein translocase subunit SecE [Candidatus Buchananbacteria bacterium RIFCSPLOWO2_02_FULL_46_11b]